MSGLWESQAPKPAKAAPQFTMWGWGRDCCRWRWTTAVHSRSFECGRAWENVESKFKHWASSRSRFWPKNWSWAVKGNNRNKYKDALFLTEGKIQISWTSLHEFVLSDQDNGKKKPTENNQKYLYFQLSLVSLSCFCFCIGDGSDFKELVNHNAAVWGDARRLSGKTAWLGGAGVPLSSHEALQGTEWQWD